MLQFGSDPEYFAVYKVDNKKFVLSPAMMEMMFGIKRLGGDDKHPVFIISPNNYSWMGDGVAWELTLLKPHKSLQEMRKVIDTALSHLQEYISKHSFNGSVLELCTDPVVNIQNSLYNEYLDDPRIYQGYIFGCDPDLDAWEPQYVCEVQDASVFPLRYGGGHIHVSGSGAFKDYPIPSIRCMSLLAGNFAIAKSPVPEMEYERVKTYGRPGRYRNQAYKNSSGDIVAYGIEYRSPSNTWTKFSEEDTHNMEMGIRVAAYMVEHPEVGVPIVNYFGERTCKAINTVDQKDSQEIFDQIMQDSEGWKV